MNPTIAHFISVLAFFCSSLSFALPEVDTAADLETICKSNYETYFQRGRLGLRVKDYDKNTIYQMYDPLLGGVVLVTSDSNGNIVPQPLGSGSVFECSYGRINPEEGESKMCELKNGEFKALPKGDKRAVTRSVYRLAYTGGWSGRSIINGFEWEQAQEIRLGRRDNGAVRAAGVSEKRKLANEMIVPGKSVPKFYRKNGEYWGYVNGDNFPIKRDHWMQLFADGNYYVVRRGHHLDQWPGEPSIMVEVPDTEEWIKIGRGSEAFVLAEKPLGPKINWKKYYRKKSNRPANPRVSARDVCTGCEKP